MKLKLCPKVNLTVPAELYESIRDKINMDQEKIEEYIDAIDSEINDLLLRDTEESPSDTESTPESSMSGASNRFNY